MSDALHYLGFWPLGLVESARALGLTALLFAGPLFLYLVVDDGWKDWAKGEPVKEVWGDMLSWRNIVAVSSPRSPFSFLFFSVSFSFGCRPGKTGQKEKQEQY